MSQTIWRLANRWELIFNPRVWLVGFSMMDLTATGDPRALCLFLNCGPFILAWTSTPAAGGGSEAAP